MKKKKKKKKKKKSVYKWDAILIGYNITIRKQQGMCKKTFIH
jgi:hypothetical protein